MASVILLECKHTLSFKVAPTLDEIIWCARCQIYSRVIAAGDEWRIKCQDCTYGKSFGTCRLESERAASKHCQKKGHAINIYNGKRLMVSLGEWLGRKPRRCWACERESFRTYPRCWRCGASTQESNPMLPF